MPQNFFILNRVLVEASEIFNTHEQSINTQLI